MVKRQDQTGLVVPPGYDTSGRPASLSPGLRLESVVGGPLRDKAEAFVYDIYRSVGYCAESPNRKVEELQRWSEDATFHIVVDEDDDVVGTVRTVCGTYDDLPIGQFVRTDDRHTDPLCELGALAVEPSARSTGVIEHLYRAGWLFSARSGCSALVGVIESWLLDVFTADYGMPFIPIGEGRVYLGGYSIPTALPLAPETYVTVADKNPGFLWWNSEAAEVAEIVDWGFPLVLTDEVHEHLS